MIKRFKNNIKGIFQNNVFVLLDQGLLSGLNFTVAILLARFMGITIYGEFVVLWTLILFFFNLQQAFVISPFQSLQTTDLTKNVYNQRGIALFFYTNLLITIVGLFGLTVLTKVFIPEIQSSNYTSQLIITAISFLFYDYLKKVSIANNNTKTAFIMTLVLSLLQFSGLLALYIVKQLTLENWLWITAVSYTAAFVSSLNKIPLTVFSPSLHPDTIKRIWNYNRWLVLTSILQWFSGNYYLLAAAGLIGSFAVGAIRIIQNLYGLLNIVFQAMENKIPVSASKIYSTTGFNDMGAYFFHIMKYISPIILLSIGLLITFKNSIIELIYGSQYLEYSWLSYYFGLLYIVILLAIPFRFILRTISKTNTLFISYAITSIFALISAQHLINELGIKGILLGMIISQLISLIVFIYTIMKFGNNLKKVRS
jgi:O-antigen/teichoic acid export membrane protein